MTIKKKYNNKHKKNSIYVFSAIKNVFSPREPKLLQKHENIAELQAGKQRNTWFLHQVSRQLLRRNLSCQFLNIKNNTYKNLCNSSFLLILLIAVYRLE